MERDQTTTKQKPDPRATAHKRARKRELNLHGCRATARCTASEHLLASLTYPQSEAPALSGPASGEQVPSSGSPSSSSRLVSSHLISSADKLAHCYLVPRQIDKGGREATAPAGVGQSAARQHEGCILRGRYRFGRRRHQTGGMASREACVLRGRYCAAQLSPVSSHPHVGRLSTDAAQDTREAHAAPRRDMPTEHTWQSPPCAQARGRCGCSLVRFCAGTFADTPDRLTEPL